MLERWNSTTKQHFVIALKYHISMRETLYQSKLIKPVSNTYNSTPGTIIMVVKFSVSLQIYYLFFRKSS